MNGTFISGIFDSIFLRGDDKRIILVVEVYDDFMEMPQHITIDITNELQKIYQGVEFDKDFVQRIEKKLRLTLGKKSVYIQYSTKYNWVLDKPLKELYSPVLLTLDKVKFGDPLKIKATLISFKRLKEGKEFPMSGLIAECIVGIESPTCFVASDKLNIDIMDKKASSTNSKVEIAYIDIDYEFDYIYNELKVHKCNREKFVDKSSKLVKKCEVYNRIAKIILGKTLTLEYDEYFGYSIWEPLVYLIDGQY